LPCRQPGAPSAPLPPPAAAVSYSARATPTRQQGVAAAGWRRHLGDGAWAEGHVGRSPVHPTAVGSWQPQRDPGRQTQRAPQPGDHRRHAHLRGQPQPVYLSSARKNPS
jgi:hypothetical protein